MKNNWRFTRSAQTPWRLLFSVSSSLVLVVQILKLDCLPNPSHGRFHPSRRGLVPHPSVHPFPSSVGAVVWFAGCLRWLASFLTKVPAISSWFSFLKKNRPRWCRHAGSTSFSASDASAALGENNGISAAPPAVPWGGDKQKLVPSGHWPLHAWQA